jgi:cytochrome c biogenesis protein CcdA
LAAFVHERTHYLQNILTLYGVGAANTVGDLPTAFPYLMFIAKIVEMKISVGLVLPLLALYCLIYILPLLVIYVLYIVNKKKMEHMIQKVQEKVAVIGKWAVVVLLPIAGVFLCLHGFENIYVL